MKTINSVFIGCINRLAVIAELGLILTLTSSITLISTSTFTTAGSSLLVIGPVSSYATISLALLISSLILEVGLTSIVPGYAYILASDLGAGALCLLDYCNYSGVITLLLILLVLGNLITNCDY